MRGNEPDYYAILGVSRDAEAVVIKAAWRALVQKYHPDKFDGPADVAQKKTTEINRAYVVLSDSELRKEYDETTQASKQKASPSSDESSHTGSPAAPPDSEGKENNELPPSIWIRFLARTIDLFVAGFIAGFVISLFANEFAQKTNAVIFGILIFPPGLIIDSAIYYTFGNTPGKALLGIHVADRNGSSPGFLLYTKRNFLLWLYGLALGIPLINLIASLAQANKIRKLGITTYDEKCGTHVHGERVGVLRVAFALLITVAIIIFGVVISSIENKKQQRTSEVDWESGQMSEPEIDWTHDPNRKPSASHEQVQQAADQSAIQRKSTEDHFSRIYAAHPDAKDIVSSQLFNQWASTKTTDEINYIMFVIERGTADEVISMLDRFKSESWRATNKTQELAQKQSARQARCTKKAENELSFCQSQVPDEASEQFIGALGRCKTIANNTYDTCMGNK